MVCTTQSSWVCGLRLSSGILRQQYLEFRTIDKVQNPSNSVLYIYIYIYMILYKGGTYYCYEYWTLPLCTSLYTSCTKQNTTHTTAIHSVIKEIINLLSPTCRISPHNEV
jgi:hypothetical protein